MLSILLIAGLCLAGASADNQSDLRWAQFKVQFNKNYAGFFEETLRRRVFDDNMKMVEKHNTEAANGLHTYTMDVSRFTDMTNFEVNAMYNGYRKFTTSPAPETFQAPTDAPLPTEIDWRSKGLVTPVKDQGSCGSCWAFSAVGSMEGQHKKSSGQLVSLSERQLVDCSFLIYGNLGCFGGQMDNAFKYVIAKNGSETEKSYPYTDKIFQKCMAANGTVAAQMKSYVDVKSGDEKALMAAVASIGPISVAIDASQPSFKAYKSGIYYEPACSNTTLDHGVTLVGYGTETGGDYWLVKNSWNATWGDAGYIKMARNKGNNCGIATQPSYPVPV